MQTLLLSHSSRQTWQQCHKKWYWQVIERLEPKGYYEPFHRGTLGHQLLDQWARDKRIGDTLVEEAYKQELPLLGDALQHYFLTYIREPIKYLGFSEAINEDLGVIISTSGKMKVHAFFVGELDAYVEFEGKEWVLETKFTTQVPSDLVGRFQLDDQVRGYTWAKRRKGLHPVGALVNIVRTTKNPYVVRDFVPLDQSELDRWHREMMQVAQEITDALEENRFPLSPHSCFNYGTCPMRVLCLNPDRVMFVDHPTSEFHRKEKLHEEEVIERVNRN